MLKKIVIIGPESTGKTSLSEDLAKHFNTRWCPEYARDYLMEHGAKYTYEDLLTIAKGQVALEEEYIKQVGSREFGLPTPDSRLLFFDTNMYVMQVWCEFVFEKTHRFILDQIVERKYDLYLLCNIDLPWTHDELREYPAIEPRIRLYKMYRDIMINQSTPWVEIRGSYEERFNSAVKAVNDLFSPA